MINRRTMLAGALALIPAAACAGPAGTALIVYRSPLCGCCGAWVDHLRASGFDVRVVERDDIAPVARRLGVPDALRSCHTAVAGGYFVEGHVAGGGHPPIASPAPRRAEPCGSRHADELARDGAGRVAGGLRNPAGRLRRQHARFASHNLLSRTKG